MHRGLVQSGYAFVSLYLICAPFVPSDHPALSYGAGLERADFPGTARQAGLVTTGECSFSHISLLSSHESHPVSVFGFFDGAARDRAVVLILLIQV